MNKIIIGDKWGLFLGKFDNNIFHNHYAVQLTIPLFHPIKIYCADTELSTIEATIIPSNIKHKIDSKHPLLLILINPFEIIIKEKSIFTFEHSGIEKIQKLSKSYLNNEINIEEFELAVRLELGDLINGTTQEIDERIAKGLNYLRANTDRIVSLSEISRHCYLSESRFIHLFKSEVGITYRRTQLWYKIIQSFNGLKTKTVTETAYTFGFTDGAHYSKAFKENFGFSPKQFIINSQFIQV